MKIKIGIRNLQEAEYYLERGAEELSFGLKAIPSHCASQGFTGTPKQIAGMVRRAHALRRKVFIVANDSNYRKPEAVAPALRAMAAETGVDGFIVSNPEIISAFPGGKPRVEWHLSTLAMCFNSEVLAFYREYGISRFIIPQHVMPAEAGAILAARRGLEAEAFFILREMCINIDGLCYGCDGSSDFGYPDTICCHRAFSAGKDKTFTMPKLTEAVKLEYFFDYSKHADVLKIARDGDTEKREIVFDEARALLKLAARHHSKARFLTEARALIAAEFWPRYDELHRRRGLKENWEGECRKLSR
jgi:hypothetical protein